MEPHFRLQYDSAPHRGWPALLQLRGVGKAPPRIRARQSAGGIKVNSGSLEGALGCRTLAERFHPCAPLPGGDPKVTLRLKAKPELRIGVECFRDAQRHFC